VALFSRRHSSRSFPQVEAGPPQQDPIVYLDVPYAQKDEAKTLGARWDATARRWFVPAGIDSPSFSRWLPDQGRRSESEQARKQDEMVGVAVVGLPRACYRCGSSTTSVVGILVPPHLSLDPHGFVELEFCSESLAHVLNEMPDRVRHRVGRVRRRTSRVRPDGYIANGCFACDALQGSFPLREELTEFLADRGAYEDLVIAHVQLPVSAIPSWYE